MQSKKITKYEEKNDMEKGRKIMKENEKKRKKIRRREKQNDVG